MGKTFRQLGASQYVVVQYFQSLYSIDAKYGANLIVY